MNGTPSPLIMNLVPARVVAGPARVRQMGMQAT